MLSYANVILEDALTRSARSRAPLHRTSGLATRPSTPAPSDGRKIDRHVSAGAAMAGGGARGHAGGSRPSGAGAGLPPAESGGGGSGGHCGGRDRGRRLADLRMGGWGYTRIGWNGVRAGLARAPNGMGWG